MTQFFIAIGDLIEAVLLMLGFCVVASVVCNWKDKRDFPGDGPPRGTNDSSDFSDY